ncbi:mammalian cell entry protein [Thiocapsa imhoffii]|uniref:Mammalian cell entry protein n=1 Tax=Thiocapsa imhoffii TaxID=382777 RepID=A0A9X1B847_9GAMM|nr:MlaD family protein [Thiocapsa imhoffii]MBK1644402.1 mammalian cell entry protein [Thiocapsa imhoffii]
MSKQANPTVIGGFVLGALALFAFALILFGSGAFLRERIPMVTFFPGSVQGLNVGAPVQFEGVTVGRVTGIELNFTPETGVFSVPVSYELWPDSVNIRGEEPGDSAEEILRVLVRERGLHARLESVSFVTGQYMIALQLQPGRTSQLLVDPDDVIEVPSLEATRDRMTEMLENLRLDDLVNEAALTLASIRQLIGSGEVLQLIRSLEAALDQTRALFVDIDREVEPIATQLRTTLSDYSELARLLSDNIVPWTKDLDAATDSLIGLVERVDAQVVPIATGTQLALAEFQESMRVLRQLTIDLNGTRARADTFLTEASGTARALRSFADQLDRHPEVLLRGRR